VQYLILLYGDETRAAEPGTPAFDDEMAAYAAFSELAESAIRGGAALHLTDRARTIRHGGNAVTVTDGPFAETTEALGGYFVLEADNLDDVIELVRHIPATTDPGGASEIRPLARLESSIHDEHDLRDAWLATMHAPTSQVDGRDHDGWEVRAPAHRAFREAAGDGVLEAGVVERAATTVRVRDGEVLVADGPCSASIELVGGYYVLRGSAEEALELAEQIPVVEGGAVELRPILDLTEDGG
jgi:hypothetical protein